MANKLHIISFDVPLPANYGGVVDVFYKLKHLSQSGYRITLHCFTSSTRKENDALNEWCDQVFYYPRLEGIRGLSLTQPYIVSSRKNKDLLKNLMADESPILFEGIHTTYYANFPELKHRKKILRAHNIEHEYYDHLYRIEHNIFRKLYFGVESFLLKKYEKNLSMFDEILPISQSELPYFKAKHKQVKWLPAFHPYTKIQSLPGKGNYCLYHGNLSVKENEEAVLFLVKEVFSKMNIPFIIAGKNPSRRIMECASPSIRVVDNPDDLVLEELIQQAHIHVLPSFQKSGVKLKLLHTLFAGRFCIANDTMLEGSGIKASVIRANHPEEFIKEIETYKNTAFSSEDIEIRKKEFIHPSLYSIEL